MIDMTGHVNFDGKRLRHIVAEGNAKAVVRSAAYLRGAAKRKVKRRKFVHSKPGNPPYAHESIFKASILFGVNAAKTDAVIGPARLSSGRTNWRGDPIPNILEKGGMAALGVNHLWIHKRVPRGVNDESSIAAYFKGLGTGPVAYGKTPDEADAKVDAGKNRGKRSFGRHPRRFSPILRKFIYLTYLPIRSDHQARKAARTVIDVFGYPVTNRPIRIAPRPLMAPTLAENKEKIAGFWQHIVK